MAKRENRVDPTTPEATGSLGPEGGSSASWSRTRSAPGSGSGTGSPFPRTSRQTVASVHWICR